jgi:hypothetical protein
MAAEPGLAPVRRADLSTLNPYRLAFNIRYAPRARCIYFNIPKAGCSSVLWSLTRYERDDPALLPEHVGTIHARDGSPILRGADIADLDALLHRDDLLRFTLVRNPFDRILSCYLNKVIRDTPQRRIVLAALGREAEAAVTLADFLRFVAAQPPAQRDPHWATQDDLLFNGALPIDMIGRFERFTEDFAAIGRRIAPDFDRYVHVETRHGTGAKDYALIGAAEADAIRAIYAADFARFGYGAEVPGGSNA